VSNMNIEQARFNMIEQQIRPWDVLDLQILDLLMVVKREAFVPDAYKALAFVDTEIPLPCGGAMFTPKMEARILQETGVRKHENVLEIGAGSGYMAALLAHRARHVTSVEIEPELQALAQKNLTSYGLTNVDVVQGDGARGWASAEYDVIVISGALPVLAPEFLKQIKVGGRILAIVGEAPVMSAEVVTRIASDRYQTVKLFETCVTQLRNAAPVSHFHF
jgi:protein-L-isoaspartate(D-aspartate) O-methyltransferase